MVANRGEVHVGGLVDGRDGVVASLDVHDAGAGAGRDVRRVVSGSRVEDTICSAAVRRECEGREDGVYGRGTKGDGLDDGLRGVDSLC